MGKRRLEKLTCEKGRWFDLKGNKIEAPIPLTEPESFETDSFGNHYPLIREFAKGSEVWNKADAYTETRNSIRSGPHSRRFLQILTVSIYKKI